MKFQELTVFIRIGLYILIGRMIAGGILPVEVQGQVNNPHMVEMMVTGVVALVTGLWYWFSAARKALRNRL